MAYASQAASSSADQVVNLYVIAARGLETKTGLEVTLTTNYPDESIVYVRSYWKPHLKFKLWEDGMSLAETNNLWLKAINAIKAAEISVPARHKPKFDANEAEAFWRAWDERGQLNGIR